MGKHRLPTSSDGTISVIYHCNVYLVPHVVEQLDIAAATKVLGTNGEIFVVDGLVYEDYGFRVIDVLLAVSISVFNHVEAPKG